MNTDEETPNTINQSKESSFVVFSKSPTNVLNNGIVASEKWTKKNNNPTENNTA